MSISISASIIVSRSPTSGTKKRIKYEPTGRPSEVGSAWVSCCGRASVLELVRQPRSVLLETANAASTKRRRPKHETKPINNSNQLKGMNNQGKVQKLTAVVLDGLLEVADWYLRCSRPSL